MNEPSLQIAIIVSTILGPLFGVLIAWILAESASIGLQARRAKAQARFDLVREMMRLRQQPERKNVLNEIPLLFSDSEDVMRLWRQLATPPVSVTADDVEPLTKRSVTLENQMLAAMVAAVGLKAVADKDLENLILIGDFEAQPASPLNLN